MYALQIVLSVLSKIKLYTFFLIVVSTFSSLFNALSAVSLIPIVSMLLGQDINFEIIVNFELNSNLNFY